MPSAVLIGLPASGKSSVGKALAKQLGVAYVDTDHVIEEKTGKTLSAIFAEIGEIGFRQIEKGVVLDSIKSGSDVISLGGGSILIAEVCESLKSLRVPIIYLTISESQALKRIGDGANRPLLAGSAPERWRALAASREPIYRSLATLEISTDSKKAIEIAQYIKEYIFAEKSQVENYGERPHA